MGHANTMTKTRGKGIILLLTLALAGPIAPQQPASHAWAEIPTATGQQLLDTYGKLPLSFEANQGQTDPQVKYLSRGTGYTLFLTPTEAVFSLRRPPADLLMVSQGAAGKPDHLGETKTTVLRMRFVGANPTPRLAGQEELPGKSHYFIGTNPNKWHTNIRQYAKVSYRDLYPGIDVIFYGNRRQLEYDFVVAPGADPGAIELGFAGVDKLALDARGNLILHMAKGEVILHAPVIYQEINGARQTITVGYVLKGRHHVGLHVAPYDATKVLIIDPVLTYSTYLGGSDLDEGNGIAVHNGNAYVTGKTQSIAFPTVNSLQPAIGGRVDAFVAKLDAAGTTLLYFTYLGGDNDDGGKGIAVDADGNAYVTGFTRSGTPPSGKFPTTTNAPQTDFAGFTDAFVAKLDPTGSVLVYSTYLGGGAFDEGNGIDVHAGNAYVTGDTRSSDFPTTVGAAQSTCSLNSFNICTDAFVAKLNAGGSALVYSTYLGGSGFDSGNGIAVDAGNAYVTGLTVSSDFPTLRPLQPAFGGFTDAFVAKLNAGGSALDYSTYLGGSRSEQGFAIAVDAAGNAYVTGDTRSTNFPTANPLQPAIGGGLDAFVAKLNAGGSALAFSTYLGGSGEDRGSGIAVDAAGNTYVTGRTQSINFPIFPIENPVQSTVGGGFDAFVAKLDPTGSALVSSTYLGGSADELGFAIAVDAGNTYVTGLTRSTNFPPPSPIQSILGGTADAFVAKITDNIVQASMKTDIEIERARVERRGTSRYRFEVRGRFQLDDTSDGIDVLHEDVTVIFGKYAVTVPAGSFVRDDDHEGFEVKGAPGGIKKITIRDDGRFRVRARGVDLNGIDLNNPVPFSLDIGNDRGETEIVLDGRGRFRDHDRRSRRGD